MADKNIIISQQRLPTSGKYYIRNTYEIILADAIIGIQKKSGYDVFFQTGTDEHGQKIRAQSRRGRSNTKRIVNNVSGSKKIWGFDRLLNETNLSITTDRRS